MAKCGPFFRCVSDLDYTYLNKNVRLCAVYLYQLVSFDQISWPRLKLRS